MYMGLTWKDIATTILALCVFGIYYAMSKGVSLPLITGYRGAILVLALLGIAMCSLSGGTNTNTGVFFIAASFLGVVALVLIIYGLITGTKIAFVLLAVNLIVLWLIATLRHLLKI